jgi:hypothetical protein
MHYYRVVLEGANFYIEVNGEEQLMGFYTIRFVEAKDPEHAENLAVAEVNSESRLQGALRNSAEQPEPKIYLDEIYVIKKSEMESAHGYAWFPMTEK